ncbi:src kinase-associated phosphoprotein 2-like [Stegodyphus dumicola]|uniref:src kinase-associated phosphoprotein 2-like n=1 Tax=Stegodyphus dumicola TaxID=202533 RepID=UPI0015ABF843|nr:src kinase-associated phosphoprotein 2-like [Stegodyphus dumicola]
MYGNLAQVCLCSWDSNMQDIPASNSFINPHKTGLLQKLVGRGWLYSGTWKPRYCVLDGSKFYFYENEQSKGNEKTCGVINLDYYDLCEENNVKDKKNPHVFIIGTSVRGFFDNRHQFSAGSADEMQSWIRSIQAAITEARQSRRKAGRKQQRHLEGKSPDLSSSSQCTCAFCAAICLRSSYRRICPDSQTTKQLPH